MIRLPLEAIPPMPQLTHLPAILLLSLLLPEVCGDESKSEFFENNIRPVLVEHCYSCHASTATNVRGGLLIDSKAGMEAGGDSGTLLVPGNPNDSLLISALRHESFEMPPDQKLPDSVVRNFEKWIQDGAIDPRVNGVVLERRQIDMQEGRKFWSFQPIQPTTIPDAGSSWAKSDVDRFVAAGHRKAKLAVAADATAEQMARRLYFVITGLPPTPDQTRDFETRWQVNADEATAAVADELLASPRFGERWGRHWLDVVRYAESSGGGRSLMFPDAWRFREYVIQSFNNDKPIDQLITEHIAGDLIAANNAAQHDDQLTGTGFLALGPTNYELQDKQLLQMEVIDEQIDTTGRAFLGLTIGCARCHDHKFDPIPTADYYAMAGIFRSTESLLPGNVSNYVTTKLTAGTDATALAIWRDNESQLKRQIAELSQTLPANISVAKFIDPNQLPGIIIDDDDAIFEGDWATSTMIAPFVGSGYRHNSFEPIGKSVRFEANLPDGEYEVRLCHNYANGRCNHVPVSIHHADGVTAKVIDQSKRPRDGVFTSIGTFRFAEAAKAIVAITPQESSSGVVIIDALQFLPRKNENSKKTQATTLRKAKHLETLKSDLKNLQKRKPIIPQVMSVRDGKNPADDHIHIRGAVRNIGAKVPRGFMTVAGEFDSAGQPIQPVIPVSASGRLELAEWLVSPSNPLPSRVFVNRVWQHVIGEGIVRTPDNFGAMGQKPTHPELLDHLAWSFVHKDNWSAKTLIRRLVCSRAFRMSSEGSAVSTATDPDNLHLTHGFRRRLNAEAIRDSLLQISGNLNTRITGKTIARISQYDNGYDHETHSQNMRSVYVPFFRNSMLEIFSVYDIANPNLVTGRRHNSTLPSQALFMMNSPFILECAQSAATRFISEFHADQSIPDRINTVSMMCLGRSSTLEEQTMLSQFVTSSTAPKLDVWTSVFQAMFSSLDFRFVD